MSSRIGSFSRVERVRLADGSSLILKRSRRPLIDEGRVLQGLRLHRHIRGPTMTATGTPTDNVYTRIGVKGARHHGYTAPAAITRCWPLPPAPARC